MTRLYCPECSEYLEGGDGECHDCSCGWKQPVETFEDEASTLKVAYDELCEELKESQRQVEVAAEFCRQYQIENKQLRERNSGLEASRIAYANEFPLNSEGESDVGSIHHNIRELKKSNSHLQFLLDSVMLEFCPDEMTEEQMENWKKHQKKSNLEILL